MTSRPGLVLVFLVSLVPALSASADPLLIVSNNGVNVNSNREWLVEVAPDASLFSGGMGSLALELAFEITGSELLSASLNASEWPFSNPGNNPFTGGVTVGLQTDLVGDTVFAAFLSNPFSSGSPVALLTIETMGSGATTLSWGGHTLLPGTPFEYTGSRIAQAGMGFDGYQGMLTLGGTVAGDFNNDGAWDCLDIDALTNAVATSSGDLSFDMNGDGSVTFADVDDPVAGWLTVGGANNPAATNGNAFLPGDANLDGDVNGRDFLFWNVNKFTENTNWCNSNFDGDLNVDGSDFLIWNRHKFMSSDVVRSVPEPSSWLLGLAAILWCFHGVREET